MFTIPPDLNSRPLKARIAFAHAAMRTSPVLGLRRDLIPAWVAANMEEAKARRLLALMGVLWDLQRQLAAAKKVKTATAILKKIDWLNGRYGHEFEEAEAGAEIDEDIAVKRTLDTLDTLARLFPLKGGRGV